MGNRASCNGPRMLEPGSIGSPGEFMMSIRQAAIGLAFAGVLLVPASGTMAQTAPSGMRIAQAGPAAEPAAQERRQRPLKRLRIYPRYEANPDGVYPSYYPGPNAVRDCTAT